MTFGMKMMLLLRVVRVKISATFACVNVHVIWYMDIAI